MEKPISLILEEAKVELVNAINEVAKKHNLSMYLTNIIMSAIYQEIVNLSNAELQQEAQNYEKSKTEKDKEEK